MIVVSLKDYAAQNNISYEAVRQQIVRYKDELGPHIIRDGRQQFLDEEAVAFLDSRRMKNPVAIIQQSKDEAIEALRLENERLRRKLEDVQDRVYDLQLYKLEAEEKRRALEDAQTAQKRREREIQDREDAFAQELATARQEAAEAAQKAAEDAATQELARAEQRHQGELTAAQGRLQKYREEVAAYNKLPGLRRIFTKAPVLQED